jgi:hypothetical protein
MVSPMSSLPRSRSIAVSGARRRVAAAGVVVAGMILAACGSSGSSTATTTSTTSGSGSSSASGLVLGATYATSIGFPRTVQAAKTTAVTQQKDCSSSVEAVYEDSAGKTGLISDVLRCSSNAAAVSALAVARKHASIETSVTVPKVLGPTAFVTNSSAPEYLMIWQAGTKVAITAIDVDVTASASSSGSSASKTPLSAAQGSTLSRAAVEQNTLYR